MVYRIEELAAAAELRVDTIRFYQGRGLSPPPRRRGRVALYDEEHLERLRHIRSLKRRGFSLDQIQLALTEPEREPLLRTLVERGGGGGGYRLSLGELARAGGVSEPLIEAATEARLLSPEWEDGREWFSEADLEIALGAKALLAAGIEPESLLQIAADHHRHVEALCWQAVALFEARARGAGDGSGGGGAETGELFRELLPAITGAVARHFQRTLARVALGRLRERSSPLPGTAERLRERSSPLSGTAERLRKRSSPLSRAGGSQSGAENGCDED